MIIMTIWKKYKSKKNLNLKFLKNKMFSISKLSILNFDLNNPKIQLIN